VTVYEVWAVGGTTAFAVSYRRTLGVRCIAGTPVILGGGYAGGEQGEDPEIAGATMLVTVSGGNVLVRVQGVAATNMSWSATVDQKRTMTLPV
jgi:hypothetical protein